MVLQEILKKKVNQRSHDEKVFVAATIIKQSWADDADSEERAEDAAYLIERRENWSNYTPSDVKKTKAEIMEYF
jgi:hypothetical protein